MWLKEPKTTHCDCVLFCMNGNSQREYFVCTIAFSTVLKCSLSSHIYPFWQKHSQMNQTRLLSKYNIRTTKAGSRTRPPAACVTAELQHPFSRIIIHYQSKSEGRIACLQNSRLGRTGAQDMCMCSFLHNFQAAAALRAQEMALPGGHWSTWAQSPAAALLPKTSHSTSSWGSFLRSKNQLYWWRYIMWSP